MTAVVLVLLTLALVGGLLGWVAPRGTPRPSAVLTYGASSAVLLLTAAGAVAALDDVVTEDPVPGALALALTLAIAICGGPVVLLVFALVDRGPPLEPDEGLGEASSILRGGAWIGALERAAIFVTLVAGWPDGMLAVVGLKGLGRYPELRSHQQPGVAERFIIGTFASVLWAVACAGLARQLT